MQRHVGRRAFVGGGVAASAGLLALAGFNSHAAQAQAPSHSHGPHRSDPVLRLFIREAAALRREIKRDRLRGEHARRLAAALRMVAVYGAHADLDGAVAARIRQLLRERGRAELLRTPFDHSQAIAELRAHGIVDPEELPNAGLLTDDQRRRGLDELLGNGVTPVLARQSELVDREAAALDRYGSVPAAPVVRVALRQDDPPPVSREQCEFGWELQIMPLRAMSIFVCVMPPLWELCVLIQSDILLMEMAKWYFCSDNP